MNFIELKSGARRYGVAGTALLLLGLSTLPAFAQARPERSLAGITIGRPVSQVLNRYGNPSRIETGAFTGQMDFGQAMGALGGMVGNMATSMVTGMPGQDPAMGMGPMPGAVSPAPGGMPGQPGGIDSQVGNVLGRLFGPPQQAPGMGAVPGMEQQQAVPRRPITRYFYDYPTGPSLVFTVGHRGLVEQIDAFAPWPWSPARTSRGIGIGATYKQVSAKYGFPGAQRHNADGTLVMDYSERANVAFTLLGGRVVGVSVALVE